MVPPAVWLQVTNIPANLGQLDSIACPSAVDCVAVGQTTSAVGVAIETENGGLSWTTDSVPSSGPLVSVSCPAVGKCIAVGEGTSGGGVIDLQSPTHDSFAAESVPSGVGEVSSVSCYVASSICSAIGYPTGASAADDIITTTHGGSSWAAPITITISGASSVALTAIQCVRNQTCTAVGSSSAGSTFVWTTNTWSTYSSATYTYNVGLDSISCPTPAFCLGSGTSGSYTGSATGGSWSEHSVPDPASGDLCISSTDCVVVGDVYDQGDHAFDVTFDGAVDWYIEEVAGNASSMFGASCTSSGLCFSVGETSTGGGIVLVNSGDFMNGPLGGSLTDSNVFPGDSGETCVPCLIKSIEGQAGYAVSFAGDPVDTANGDLSESATDSSVAGYGPVLDFTRTYNSELAEDEANDSLSPGPLGYGWSENWDAYLSFGTGTVAVTEGSGASNVFTAPSASTCPTGEVDPAGASTADTYCAAPRESAALTTNSSGTTYTYTLGSGTSYAFNSSGQLTAVTDSNGASDTVAYNTPTPSGSSTTCNTSYASSCVTITGPGAGDRYLVLAFNAVNDGGQILRVTDPALRQWKYTYNAAHDLTSVSDPRGYLTRYGYGNDIVSGTSTAGNSEDLITTVRPNNWTGASGLGSSAVSNFCNGTTGAPGYETVFCYTDAKYVYGSTTEYGGVVKQGDPMQGVTTFSYSNGFTETPPEPQESTTVTDPDSNTTTDNYVYGELVAETLGTSGGSYATWYFVRDPNTSLVTQAVDPDGDVTVMSYDALGNVISKTNSLGQSWTSTYNGFDEPTCTTLPEAKSGCSSLSPPGAVSATNTTVTPPSTAPPAFVTYDEYDTEGDPVWSSAGQYAPGATSATNTETSYDLYNGQSVTIAGDVDSCSASAPEHGLPCATVSPAAIDTETGASAVTQLGYDSDGDLTSSTIPDGNSGAELATTTMTYNADGQVLAVIAPLGNIGTGNGPAYTTAYTYNADGEVTVTAEGTGSAERTTNDGYDSDDNLTSVENALSGTTTTTYDADDEASLVTDNNGNSTLTCYDGDGNVAEVVPPVGVAGGSLTPPSCPTSFPADDGDRLATDATTYQYDVLGHMTVSTTPAPQGQSASYETTTNTYDPDGRLIETETPSTDPVNDPNGVVTLDNYDAAGRLLATSTGTGSSLAVTSYCYDPDNDTTAVVPPDGNSGASVTGGLTLTGYATCSPSSPYETTSAYETGYSFDSTGNELTVTRPATAAAPSGATTTDTYDAARQLATTTDPNSVKTTLIYTPLGQMTGETYSGTTHSVTDSYDADGDLTQMVDGTGTSTYSYDAFGDAASYENGAGESVGYVDNKLGQPTSITYPLPSGTTWDTTATEKLIYDDTGLLKSFTDLANSKTQFAYTPDDLLQTVTFPGTIGTESLSYDNADDIDEVTSAMASTLTYADSFEPSGAVASESDTGTGAGTSPGYTYDPLGRVTTDTPSGGSATTYTYDGSSNLTTLPAGPSAGQTGTYDDASELTGITSTGGAISLVYDADGERLTEKQGTSTLASGGWNGRDELTSYSDSSADMSAAAYDGNGLRESDTVASTSQSFLWDASSSNLLEDGSNLYLYGRAGRRSSR